VEVDTNVHSYTQNFEQVVEFRFIHQPSSGLHSGQILKWHLYVWQAIEDHHRAHSNGLGVSAILDVGCSTGESTQALAAGFPDAKLVVGL
jgi:hypothetical protein